MAQCPTCGDEFKNTQGMKTHHTKIHGESLAGVESVCDNCGNTFRHKKCDKGRFCDSDCYAEWQSENKTGADNPNAGEFFDVDCANCGDTLSRSKARMERSENHFCDTTCYGEWRSENVVKDDHPNWRDNEVTVECSKCGTEFQSTEEYESRFEHSFCGSTCMGKWQSENITGEEHPAWNGGETNYAPGWTVDLRSEVRERDGFECADCGVSQESHIENVGMKLDVHHIRKAKRFEQNDRRMHDKENLITLCRKCHKKWEKMSPLRPV